jgi:uncharacterized protein (DUF58 family)
LFTTKATLYFALAITSLTLGLVLGDFQLGILALGLATLFFLANAWGLPEKVDLQLAREVVPNETFGGEEIIVNSSIGNTTHSNIANLEVHEALPSGISPSKGTNRMVASLRPGEFAEFSLELTNLPRDNYQIGPLVARAKDPYGFYLVEKRLESETLSVMPRPQRIGAAQLRPRHVRAWPGMVPSRILGIGSEFYSTRQYVSGDDPKRINWKASARHDELIVNETEADRVTDVMIVLDTDVAVFQPSEHELFERGVEAAASIASLLLRQGNRVGLVLQGGERGSLPAGFGKKHERRILYLLAASKPGRASVSTSYVMRLLADRMLPTRSQIIVISPLLDSEMREGVSRLTDAGYNTLVLSPKPASEKFQSEVERVAFNLAMLERSITLLSLEKSSTVIDWPTDIPLASVLSRVGRQRVMINA